MSGQYIVGIDVGTTGTKTVIFDLQGKVVSKAYTEYGCIYPKPGWVEQDAHMIKEATFDTCREAIVKSGIDKNRIACFGLSTQRACALFLDKTGYPMKMFSWQDARPEEESAYISTLVPNDEFYQVNGVPNNPAWIVPKMMWIKRNEIEIWEKTTKVVQLHDYILREMGAPDYYCDETDAGFFCTWDCDHFRWKQEYIDLFRVDINMISKVLPTGTRVGEISGEMAQRTGLPEKLPIVIGLGDQTAASIGAGVVSPGRFSISMGTGGMCLGFLDKPYRDPKGSFMIVGHAIHGCWELEGWQKGSAGIYRWFRDEIATLEKQRAAEKGADVYEILNEMIASVPAGAKGLITMPYFATAGTPRWNENARGTMMGLSYYHDKACIARSIIEGITLEHKDMLVCLKGSGIRVDSACIIGGPTRSELWNQMQADIYGVPVQKPVFEDASVLGAAIAGAYGVGIFGNIAEAADELVKMQKTYEPNPRIVPIYDELYDVYTKIYEGLDKSGAFDAMASFQKRNI